MLSKSTIDQVHDNQIFVAPKPFILEQVEHKGTFLSKDNTWTNKKEDARKFHNISELKAVTKKYLEENKILLAPKFS